MALPSLIETDNDHRDSDQYAQQSTQLCVRALRICAVRNWRLGLRCFSLLQVHANETQKLRDTQESAPINEPERTVTGRLKGRQEERLNERKRSRPTISEKEKDSQDADAYAGKHRLRSLGPVRIQYEQFHFPEHLS